MKTLLSLLVTLCLTPAVGISAEYTLTEPVSDTRVFSVTNKLTVNGQLKPSAGDGAVPDLPLKVNATIGYHERRLTGAGRDAKALRSLRQYQRCEAGIQVGEQITTARLPESHNRIVAQGERRGILFYHPEFLLSYNELELLKIPGDSLAVFGLLPQSAVDIGETWSPSDWVIQMLTGTEAVDKSELSCKLVSVKSQTARVEFEGSLQGASLGSKTGIRITGHYEYDLKNRHVRKLDMKQTELRPVQGPVTPGMDLVAQNVWERTPAVESRSLTDSAVKDIPLDPPERLLRLSFRTPWNVQFAYDRNWHLFHQTDRAVVLRLLDDGSLVAQCNLSPLSTAAPGKHLSEERFRKYIQEALGNRLESIESADIIDSGKKGAPYIYRVSAAGKANGRDMHWIYYLCADQSGRQTALAFSVETHLVKRLNKRDLEIVQALQFVSSNVKPVSSSR